MYQLYNLKYKMHLYINMWLNNTQFCFCASSSTSCTNLGGRKREAALRVSASSFLWPRGSNETQIGAANPRMHINGNFMNFQWAMYAPAVVMCEWRLKFELQGYTFNLILFNWLKRAAVKQSCHTEKLQAISTKWSWIKNLSFRLRQYFCDLVTRPWNKTYCVKT